MIVLVFFVTLGIVRAIIFMAVVCWFVVSVVTSLGLGFVDGGEVLSLSGLNFIGIFWDSVVDDWVVDWSMVISWSWFVVSVVTAITDL